jgi:hypothetical protein
MGHLYQWSAGASLLMLEVLEILDTQQGRMKLAAVLSSGCRRIWQMAY